MVKGGTTGSGVEDTGSVSLEDQSVSLDGDSDWLHGEGGLKGRHGVSADLDGTGDLDVGVGVAYIVLADTTNGLVGVGGLTHGEVSLVVVEGDGLVTAIAAEASLDAVNELLLGERKEFTGLNLPSTFEGTSGGERPAGSALTLILDGGDGTSSDPVDTGFEGGDGV